MKGCDSNVRDLDRRKTHSKIHMKPNLLIVLILAVECKLIATSRLCF